MTVSLTTQNLAHAHDERGTDAYFTPPEAVESLLKVHPLPTHVWEPAAGGGNIAQYLKDKGHTVYCSDIHDYGYPLDCQSDFLAIDKAPPGYNCIITNPPFMIFNKFVSHAKTLCDKVIILGRLSILESVGRTSILEDGTFSKLYVFRNRLPMMHRLGWTGKRNVSAMAFAWFVFDKNHDGSPATIERVTCVYNKDQYD